MRRVAVVRRLLVKVVSVTDVADVHAVRGLSCALVAVVLDVGGSRLERALGFLCVLHDLLQRLVSVMGCPVWNAGGARGHSSHSQHQASGFFLLTTWVVFVLIPPEVLALDAAKLVAVVALVAVVRRRPSAVLASPASIQLPQQRLLPLSLLLQHLLPAEVTFIMMVGDVVLTQD